MPTAAMLPDNRDVAARLQEMADLLEAQDANPFRVNAYRRAAQTVLGLDTDLRDLVRSEGEAGLAQLPFIGRGIAATIVQLVRDGRSAQLERLRGAVSPEALFESVPGVGPVLAERIHDHLQVDTLEALEIAAHDGRLEAVPGIGQRRAAAIRAGLASLLKRPSRARDPGSRPSVAELLEVDDLYRRKAARSELPRIAPRRFNPEHEPWLPILHTERGGWHFTVLFSNTARAHQLGRTGDWVVVYYYDHDHQEGQHTIVTETHGPLAGRRVVRGREVECEAHYADVARS